MEWTNEQSDEFTSLYDKFSSIPGSDRIKDSLNAELFPKSGPIPYERAKEKLLSNIDKMSHGGLEKSVNREHRPSTGIGSIFEEFGKLFSGPYFPIAASAAVLLLLYL